MTMKVYYAHSVALYNTAQEERDLRLLRDMDFEVVNPNKPEHDEGYKRRGMEYFEEILFACDALAFRANPDGSINAGVVYEIDKMLGWERPVIELPSNLFRRGLTVAETRQFLKEQGAR
jgi:hypothetical protein